MPSDEHVPTEISNLQSDLFIGCYPEMKFICKICKEPGEELLCLCDRCNGGMHPCCAGVETWIVPSKDGKKEVVPPVSDILPNSCPDCLRGVEDGYPMQAPSSSSITSYFESHTEPLHKIIEGQGLWMVHKNMPGHDLLQKDNRTIYNCYGCKMESFGLHYACENPDCSFLLHKECKSPLKETKHRFFPGLTFVFSCLHNTSDSKHSKRAHTNVFCNACGMNVNGYYYHSRDGKKNLHPCCINLSAETTCSESHVKMVLQQKTTSKCGYCDKRSVKVGNESTDNVWSYVAESENDHLHVGCMIKMLSDLGKDKMGRLISCKMTSKNGVGNMNLEIVLERARKGQWQSKFKFFIKYAKIAFGTIIAALLGDPTTLFVNTAVALIS